jgi:hypothetical protein
MQDILSRKILLKTYTQPQLYIFIGLIFVLPFFVDVAIDHNVIIGLEQSLFVILSAILFVFNDSVVGYKTITKVKNTLDKLSSDEIKTKVLNAIGKENKSTYEEFLAKTKGEISQFNKVVYKFKKKSYQLYIFFAFLGLIALFSVLIKSDSRIIVFILGLSNESRNSYKILFFLKHFIINFTIITQFFIIPIWIISALQAEKQKASLLNYLDGSHTIDNVQKYIDKKNKVDIAASLDSVIELD